MTLMKTNDAALRRVTSKIYQLHLLGADFSAVHTWKFDWDKLLSVTENFKHASSEEAALVTLGQVGAIHTHHKENFMRDEHEDSMAMHGRPMYSDWDNYPASWRLYDYLWYIDGFDYDKFVLFCKTHGIELSSAPNITSDDSAVAARSDENPARVTTDLPSLKSEEQTANISLTNLTLKLSYGGITVTLKRFNSKKGFNYELARTLLTNEDKWIGKSDVGAKAKYIQSPAKDWPKQMGFAGEMKDLFISVDAKNQKILLNPKKSLTTDEAAIIKALVNTQNS